MKMNFVESSKARPVRQSVEDVLKEHLDSQLEERPGAEKYSSIMSETYKGEPLEFVVEPVVGTQFHENLNLVFKDQASLLSDLSFLFRECGAILAGGLPLKVSCARKLPEKGQLDSDFDFFFSTTESFEKAVRHLYQNENFYHPTGTKFSITFERRNDNVYFQLILKANRTPTEILNGFDFQNAMIAFNHEILWRVEGHEDMKDTLHLNPRLEKVVSHRLSKYHSQGMRRVNAPMFLLVLLLKYPDSTSGPLYHHYTGDPILVITLSEKFRAPPLSKAIPALDAFLVENEKNLKNLWWDYSGKTTLT